MAKAVLLIGLLLPGCARVSAPVSFDTAMAAAVAGNSTELETSIDQLNDGVVGECATSDYYALLRSIAAFNKSAKTRDDASIFMSAHGSSISDGEREWGVIGCESNMATSAYKASLPKFTLVLEATERTACDVLLQAGVDPKFAVGVARRRGRYFECSGQSVADQAKLSTYLSRLDNPEIGSPEVKSCERFTGNGKPDLAYRADVQALGRPYRLQVSAEGVSATWQGDYRLLIGVSPNLIRRTKGSYPSSDLRRKIEENDGAHFTDAAVSAARSSCLTEPELSRIVANAVS